MDLTQLFNTDAEPTGDEADVLNLQAAMFIQKVAEENKVDLENDVSPQEYQEWLQTVRTKLAAEQQEQQESGAAAGGAEEGAKVAAVDQRAVLSEITKRAVAHNFDISELNEAEYVQLYNGIAEQLADPGYQAEMEDYHQKLASHQEAYAIGQTMSAGFLEGLSEVDKEAGAKEKVRKGIFQRLGEGAANRSTYLAGAVKNRAGTVGKDVAHAVAEERGLNTEDLKGMRRLINKSTKAQMGGAHARLGKQLAGGAAAATGAVGAGGYAATRDKKSSTELADAIHERALEIIAEEQAKVAGGLSAEEFEKMAAEHAFDLYQQALGQG